MKHIFSAGRLMQGALVGIIFFACFPSANAQVIVIDPGHGYNCSGSNVDGRTTTEIFTALAVGEKLRDQINNGNCGWTVHMTRTTNGNCGWVSLSQRATMSNNWNATRFISVHCNAGGGTGTETFYCNQSSSPTAQDQAFASEVQDNMVTEGQWTDRRDVEDNSYLGFHLGVLRTNNAPGCLSEIGFVDRASDAAKLNDNAWRDKFALAYKKALEAELGACSGGGNGNLAPDGSLWAVTTELSNSYRAELAFDGTVGTRWNSNGAAATNYFIVQLDNTYNINQFKVKHASSAGLSSNLNTERFYILYWNGSAWATAVSNFNNFLKLATTTHNLNITAKWVCLYITDPTFTADLYSRIPEFEVYGSASSRIAAGEQAPPLFPIFSDVPVDGVSLQALPNVLTDGQTVFSVRTNEITEGTIEIMDLTGKMVHKVPSRVFSLGENRIPADLSALPSGTYFYRLANFTGATESQKLIVQ